MSGSNPGERRGGRQRGTPNKATSERIARIASSGEVPLDYMLRVMRDATQDNCRRDDMAKAAAPYIHAKLQAHTGPDGDSPVKIVHEVLWGASSESGTS